MKNTIAIITMIVIAGCSSVQVAEEESLDNLLPENQVAVAVLHPDNALDPQPAALNEELMVAYADDVGIMILAAAANTGSSTKEDESAMLDALMEDEDKEIVASDPLEGLNRGIFWFNDKLYFYFLKPVAKGYRAIVPKEARVSVSNFFSNIRSPIRFFNAIFQGKIHDAGNEFGRFAINSTFGLLGLFDPARKYAGIRKKDEDFGQTLGTYGLGNGPYLVLPFLGPSSLRDGVGLIADAALDPVSYIDDDGDQLAVRFVDITNELSLDKDTYEGIKRDALDPYLTVRDAYMQHRAGKVKK